MDKYNIDGHKLYWHLDRVCEWQKKRVIVPVYIEVSPVSYCNHSCIFCGIDFAMNKAIQLETECFSRRLEEMGKLGIKSIMYAGEGEPLLHKDLSKLVVNTKKHGIDVAITTNGTAGNYELWNDILPHLSWIKFSIDAGSPQIYAKVHNVREEIFYKTLESIKDAVKVKKDRKLNVTIGLQFLIIEENINDIENAIKNFSDSGVNYLVLKPYSLHPQMIDKKEVYYTEEKIKFLENVLNKYKNEKKLNIIFRKNTMKKYMEKEKNYTHCYALPFWGYISSRGDFYSCSVFIGNERFNVGNIYTNNMEEIIFGEKRKKSIEFGEHELQIENECRLNCRMARINEFLEYLKNEAEHINFI